MKNFVTPVRRNLKFHLPFKKVTNWNGAGLHFSQFLNTMSLFFPEGERFFIQSVRNYRDQITDPELKKSVTAFIGQEAFHGREHAEYNEAMIAAGFPVDEMEQQVTRLLRRAQHKLSHKQQLAITIALEHLTAIMADALLSLPEVLENSDSHFTALWQWHALEETEHKSVAFDVFEAVTDESLSTYLLRTTSLITATSVFFALCYTYYFRIIRQTGDHKDIKGWWSSFRHQWLTPGALRYAVPAWFEYFKPGFHPWDQDNSHYLDRIKSLIDTVEGFAPKATSAA